MDSFLSSRKQIKMVVVADYEGGGWLFTLLNLVTLNTLTRIVCTKGHVIRVTVCTMIRVRVPRTKLETKLSWLEITACKYSGELKLIN